MGDSRHFNCVVSPKEISHPTCIANLVSESPVTDRKSNSHSILVLLQ